MSIENAPCLQEKDEDLPPWIRSERERKAQTDEGSDLPFGVYLLGSALVAIAAVSHPSTNATSETHKVAWQVRESSDYPFPIYSQTQHLLPCNKTGI